MIVCPVCEGACSIERPGKDPSIEVPCWCCGGAGEIPDVNVGYSPCKGGHLSNIWCTK